MTNSTPTPLYRILFVCLGNICRSPAGEGIMQQLIDRSPQWAGKIELDSAGTYGGNAGMKADRRMRQAASARGYDLLSISRRIQPSDFEEFDLILAMDDNNLHDLQRLAATQEEHDKVHRMTEYCSIPHVDYVPDPYYGGAKGFDHVLDILENSCQNLLDRLPKLIQQRT